MVLVRSKRIEILFNSSVLHHSVIPHLSQCDSIARQIFLDIFKARGLDSNQDLHLSRSEIMDLIYGRQEKESRPLTYLVETCREAHIPNTYILIICRLILADPDTSDNSEWIKTGSWSTIARFLLRIFLRCTADFDKVIIALDDISYMDMQSWKWMELIFEHASNTFIITSSRPVLIKHVNVDFAFWNRLNNDERENGRFIRIYLKAMLQQEVSELIASKLKLDNLSKHDFRRLCEDIFTKSGGVPALVIEILEKDYGAKPPENTASPRSDERKVRNGNINSQWVPVY